MPIKNRACCSGADAEAFKTVDAVPLADNDMCRISRQEVDVIKVNHDVVNVEVKLFDRVPSPTMALLMPHTIRFPLRSIRPEMIYAL